MTTLFLSRARLRQDASVAALARLLLPEAKGERVAAGHRLVWSLFAGDPAQKRDFLWREEGDGRFMLLSPSRPLDPHPLMEVESQPYTPNLAAGDRLHFVLRANPVISRSEAPGQRGKRHDVVMDALYATPRGARAEARFAALQQAGSAWLIKQGQAHGFELAAEPVVDGYERLRLPRPNPEPGKDKPPPPPAIFGVMDFAGTLRVTDPACFLAAQAKGFGRARGFGFGLMLIRRAV
ncbi:type I-E CRISPR-associated protein Cas6/Cse3/CasE [Teichococcus cervicalis]|uniref:CRISPR system CASCADE complex protein CasE n=1 Tax=Pseudoroseomonas cervicalis ATCC 49957 TaxID=525371 RepID=D5RPS1_9PROT|nr:type I-E CRISPR-associated protein Cas6/Cse3/CasE [Pseudoroseomonas cervicalis]EFH10698.1 CRISPR system CASCADE complex protein CasE [Pseudoroseomonas cervicalis ATCC 49957]